MKELIEQVPSNWRIALERFPIESGPRWLATIRPHGNDGHIGGWSETPEDALSEALSAMHEALGQ